ncbi:universal stress protein [Sinomonas terrae]|uniref:Universal stress protein n=1 Tax=Sinomonas terrae TaxID=2908838 RepID=A0ABS9U3A3_9MICC|nr:universal stress protein [Sinomonas terrae]MCH6471174.1 universal stress protein [Sinomonas terrae]
MSSSDRNRIVVGIDGSEASSSALAWALEEARLRGTGLRAITAWRYPVLGDATAVVPDPEAFRQDAIDTQAGQLAAADVSGVPVESVVVEGDSSQVLLDAARDADLVVVGSRGHGGFAGLLLGSVSAQLVHHATCSVVVVRPVQGNSSSDEPG